MSMQRRSELKRRTAPARQPISPASPEQRFKARHAVSIVSGHAPCDPAHLWPRGMGGCDDELCVVPLTRMEHMAFDAGALDLLPWLLAHKLVPEIQHALGHANGDMIALLHRLTGDRYVPERRAA